MHPSRTDINLFHIFAVGPLLVYIGYNKGKVDDRVFNLLMALGVIVAIYHAKRYNDAKQVISL